MVLRSKAICNVTFLMLTLLFVFGDNRSAFASSAEEFRAFAALPVSSMGRFIPAEVYFQEWARTMDFSFHEQFIAEKVQAMSVERQQRALWRQLQAEKVSSKEIALSLEHYYPLRDRLRSSGALLKLLPSKRYPGEWYSLHALGLSIYDPEGNDFKPIENFTAYGDTAFFSLAASYLEWIAALEKSDHIAALAYSEKIAALLEEGYDSSLQKQQYLRGDGKGLYYPSKAQLLLERHYMKQPWAAICLCGYSLSLALMLLSLSLDSRSLRRWAFLLLLCSFALHSAMLLVRCYILGRPPVANMAETVLYVPWVGVLAALLLRLRCQSDLLGVAAATGAVLLLILLQFTDIAHPFENVQAVLNSQYWLTIHVLMVVASYGVFILSGVLAHFYLVAEVWTVGQVHWKAHLAKAVTQAIYVGVALLIPGTLLGGVWAAESWGRFWDWDPKESWAFISIATYLLFIHAARFGYISNYGMAIGAVVGLLAISFTWYGVNYILGTGLHSYGFGAGGEEFYYGYLLTEIAFLATIVPFREKKRRKELAEKRFF